MHAAWKKWAHREGSPCTGRTRTSREWPSSGFRQIPQSASSADLARGPSDLVIGTSDAKSACSRADLYLPDTRAASSHTRSTVAGSSFLTWSVRRE